MLHVSGYGRGGPKSDRPGFGTLAEAMSGFAQVTGQPDGPPTLPPFMLADGVAGPGGHLGRDDGPLPPGRARRRRSAGRRQPDRAPGPADRVVDAGLRPARHRARAGWATASPASAPRNAYRTADGRWLAISSASPNIVVRVYRAIGRPDLAEDPDYVDPVRRQERGDGGGRAGRRLGRPSGRWTRRWRCSSRPRWRPHRSTTPSSCWPTSICVPGGPSCRSTTRNSAR